MPEDPRARILLIHAGAYVVVVVICAAVNFWFSPDNLWFVWVLLGWGIGVAAHGLAFWLRRTRRRERVFVDPRARGFTVHLFAYLAVVIVLLIVNLTVTPNLWWSYWVALGWGAGVAFHAWCAFAKRRQASRQSSPDKRAHRRPSASKPRRAHKR